ncbi:MAG: rod-binding protein [Gemmatimonadetes bacterium]|nr:rod-binding protein [Gemmatimonadota bacterium]
MTAPIRPMDALAAAPLGATRTETARPGAKASPAALLETAKQLEGLFVRQLYQAMRATVPEDGALPAGAAADTFQQLMDEQVADRTPQQWQHGLAEAITREFTRRGLVAPDAK